MENDSKSWWGRVTHLAGLSWLPWQKIWYSGVVPSPRKRGSKDQGIRVKLGSGRVVACHHRIYILKPQFSPWLG